MNELDLDQYQSRVSNTCNPSTFEQVTRSQPSRRLLATFTLGLPLGPTATLLLASKSDTITPTRSHTLSDGLASSLAAVSVEPSLAESHLLHRLFSLSALALGVDLFRLSFGDLDRSCGLFGSTSTGGGGLHTTISLVHLPSNLAASLLSRKSFVLSSLGLRCQVDSSQWARYNASDDHVNKRCDSPDLQPTWPFP